jgi:hypothetical protein
MELSELLADLYSRPQTAHVIAIDNEGSSIILMIESVPKDANENAVVLMGTPVRKKHPLEAFFRSQVEAIEGGDKRWKSTAKHQATFEKAEDGKYQVNIDGTVVIKGIETAPEAKSFASGFVFGLEVGKSEK